MSVVEQIFEKARALPEPAQKEVLDLVEKLIKQSGPVQKPAPKAKTAKQHVRLPLIDSKEPGVLNLANADIEELLA